MTNYETIINEVRAAQSGFMGCDWEHYYMAGDVQIYVADASDFNDAEAAAQAWLDEKRKTNSIDDTTETDDEILDDYDISLGELENAMQNAIDYLESAREAAKAASEYGDEIIALCEAESDDFAEMLELAGKASNEERAFGDSPSWGHIGDVITDAMFAGTDLESSDVKDEYYGDTPLVSAVADGDLTAKQADILLQIRRSAFGAYLLDSGDYYVRDWTQADVDLLNDCEAIVVSNVGDNSFYGSLVMASGAVDAHSWRNGAQTHSPKGFLQDYGFPEGAKIGDVTFSYWDGQSGCAIDETPFVITYSGDDEDDE